MIDARTTRLPLLQPSASPSSIFTFSGTDQKLSELIKFSKPLFSETNLHPLPGGRGKVPGCAPGDEEERDLRLEMVSKVE